MSHSPTRKESKEVLRVIFTFGGSHLLSLPLDCATYQVLARPDYIADSGLYAVSEDGKARPALNVAPQTQVRRFPMAFLPEVYGAFYAGFYPVVGLPSYGKSYLLSYLRDHEDFILLSCFEAPEPARDEGFWITTEEQLFHSLGEALGHGNPIALDSIQRFVFATGGGAAMAGGITPKIWTTLSSWAVCCRLLNRLILGSMNPLSDDAERLKPFEVAALGSSTGLIIMPAAHQYRISARYPATAEREFVEFSLRATPRAKAEAEGSSVTVSSTDASHLRHFGVTVPETGLTGVLTNLGLEEDAHNAS